VPAALLAAFLVFSTLPAAAATRPAVTGFTLIDASTDRPIAGYDPIRPGAVINLDTLPTDEINVRVNTNRAVQSVRLTHNGGNAKTENTEPYAVGGDQRGNYSAWTPAVGTHTIAATPYQRDRLKGQAGPVSRLELTLIRSSPAPKPAPPAPPADEGGGGGVTQSGERCGAIPGVPGGWTRRVTSTFDEQTKLGSWPGPIAARDWRGRATGPDSSGRGTYSTAKTISEQNGMLDVWVHSEGGRRYVAAPIPLIGDTVGQRVSICMRADRIPGYKIAFLLWPTDGEGNSQGEIDFPEGKLTPTGEARAFMHYDPEPRSGRSQDAYTTGTSTEDWHSYTIEWDPAGHVTSFYFDGKLIGRSTGPEVPDGPMRYVMQIETYLKGQALPPPAEGHIQIDWVTIDVPAGSAAARQGARASAN
jgi:hypothetical protein